MTSGRSETSTEWAVRYRVDGHLQSCTDEPHARRIVARAREGDPATVVTRTVTASEWAEPVSADASDRTPDA